MTKCIECKQDTSFGTGKFINRIPADNGYLCSDCQELECDVCHNKVLDYELEDGQVFCIDCMEAHNE